MFANEYSSRSAHAWRAGKFALKNAMGTFYSTSERTVRGKGAKYRFNGTNTSFTEGTRPNKNIIKRVTVLIYA
jgi:hypothetical protein